MKNELMLVRCADSDLNRHGGVKQKLRHWLLVINGIAVMELNDDDSHTGHMHSEYMDKYIALQIEVYEKALKADCQHIVVGEHLYDARQQFYNPFP